MSKYNNVTNFKDYRYRKFLKESMDRLWAAPEEEEELEIYDNVREYCERFSVPVNMKHPSVQRYLADVLKYSWYLENGKKKEKE